MSPFKRLLQSRKFLLLILDTVVSVATYFVGKYAGFQGQDIIFLIAALQPIFMVAINSIAKEDVAQLAAGTHPSQLGPDGPIG